MDVRFKEKDLESSIINLFENRGYSYLSGSDIKRSNTDILLMKDLKDFLCHEYKEINLTDIQLEKIMNNIKRPCGASLYEKNKNIYSLVNNGFDLIRNESSKSAIHINFIDFEHPESNIFRVVNQYTVQGNLKRRPDILLFINGIPVVILEFKTTIEEEKTIYDAWEQITVRYNRDIPNLTQYCLLSVISDGVNSKLGSIFTPYEFYYSWNKVNSTDKDFVGINSLLTMMDGVFTKERLISILRDFIYYPDNAEKETEIVPRYPQYFAAQKMFANIEKHLQPSGDGKGGTYFGATGCGKTYTMLFLSRLLMLRHQELFKNPTIILITDRDDLDSQTSQIFEASKNYLHEKNVRSIESREDLALTLRNRPSGGIYITTIQKFCEELGLLSNRSNIVCISDEAHRTQVGVGPKLKKTSNGVYTTYGYAKYLRDSFPNATYCGFTGTPIPETIKVFGAIVDSYTMKESSDDGITERIAYEPRLAKVNLSDKVTEKIEKYYSQCADEGANEYQIEASKKAMSKLKVVLGDPDRLDKIAVDITNHYGSLCSEKPNVVQKAMIVCSDRAIAFDLLKRILKIKPDWGIPRKSLRDMELSDKDKRELIDIRRINLVATQGQNDPKELFDACGNDQHRKILEKQFKNVKSNFQIAIVVDMWVTGFDVPSLAVMYIDKPLQTHTLIQTISRVNRVFKGKDKGLIVDYIGIQRNMMEALKMYGNPTEQSPIDEISKSIEIFRNYLSLLDDLMSNFDMSDYYSDKPLKRLMCLNRAVEFVQMTKKFEARYMGLTHRLKSAYNICFASDELTDKEVSKAQFYMGVRSILFKQTKNSAPDSETMNRHVEKMVQEAISCSGVEDILSTSEQVDVFSDEFLSKLDNIPLPNTKFNALLKLLKQALDEYRKKNKAGASKFDKRLRKVVDEYNNRDFTWFKDTVNDFMDRLTDELVDIFKDLKEDEDSYRSKGITFEEKIFYDILVKIRDDHGFEYSEDKCIHLAKEIKKLVVKNSKFTDWSNREDIRATLNMNMTVLLYKNRFPPEWDEEVFQKVLDQAKNFKSYE